MATIGKRVIGALLALVGLALTAVGVWFAVALGSSGTAEFEVHPATADPVLIGPDVLNRVDADVVVTATPTSGGSVWMALANPSDADAVVGDSKHVAVTGVSVRDWALLTDSTGTGTAPELGAADLWRQQDDAKGPVTLTVKQAGAPETLVVEAQNGQLDSLTVRITDKSWFVEAVVAALIGLFLVVAGIVLLTSRHLRPHLHHHHDAVAVPPVPTAPEGTIDPDEAVGTGDATQPTAPLALDDEAGAGSHPDAEGQPHTRVQPALDRQSAPEPADVAEPASTEPTDPQEVTR